jgi:hypothetical protein
LKHDILYVCNYLYSRKLQEIVTEFRYWVRNGLQFVCCLFPHVMRCQKRGYSKFRSLLIFVKSHPSESYSHRRCLRSFWVGDLISSRLGNDLLLGRNMFDGIWFWDSVALQRDNVIISGHVMLKFVTQEFKIIVGSSLTPAGVGFCLSL